MNERPTVVNIRFPRATRQRQLTVALGCILIGVVLALALLWLLVYQSIIATALGEPETGVYNTRLEMSYYGAAGEILKQPSGIAFDASAQRVFVTDSRRAKVYVLDTECTLLTSFDGGPDAEFKLQLPTSVAVSADGRVYVVDAATGSIVIFDALLRPVRVVRFVEEPPKAVAVIADPDGVEHLWALSFSGLSRANLDGDFDWGYFARGSRLGQFANPSDLCGLSRETSTTVFVVDSFNYRLQALTPDADSMDVEWESAEGLLDVPVSVATDGVDQVFVLDGMGASILTLDATTGALITAFGTVGSKEGDLLYPSSIDYGNERIWVVDQGNARVSVYSQTEVPRLPPPMRQHFPIELLWLLILILLALELGLLTWLASIRSSRLVFGGDALERIEARGRGSAIAEVVEDINVVSGIEPLARQVCIGARVATVPLRTRRVRILEPLRDTLDPIAFDTLGAARSLSRGVLVCDCESRLFTAAIQADVPVVDVTELIQYAISVVEDEHDEERP